MGSEERDQQQQHQPSFFKVILPIASCSKQLQIPPEFVKHIKEIVPGGATITDPLGRRWPVKLTSNIKGVFLKDGWHEFYEGQSLGNFEFLIFIYDWNMCFDVRIYGVDGLERVYTHQNDCSDELMPLEHQLGNETYNDSGEVHDVETHQQATTINEKSDTGHLKRPKVRKSSKLAINEKEIIEVSEKDMDLQFEKLQDSKSIENEIIEDEISRPYSSQKFPPTEVRRKGRLAKTDGFCSKFPFFQKYMMPHNFQKNKQIFGIPSKFAKRYLPNVKSKITLRCKGGKTWEMIYTPIKTKPVFTGGWIQFARDNKLELGDVCIFELVKEMEMQVHIFTWKDQGLQLHKPEQLEKPKGLNEVFEKFSDSKSFQSKNIEDEIECQPSIKQTPSTLVAKVDRFCSKFPFFQNYIRQSVNKISLFGIPYTFADMYMPIGRAKMTLRNEHGESWEVSYAPKKNKPCFSGGWFTFALANNLEKGDLCVFELVKRREMRVYIFKKCNQSNIVKRDILEDKI